MKQYRDFKNFHSVLLLALVDAKYRFILASLNAPGNTHDLTLFQSTTKIDDIVDDIVDIIDETFPIRSLLLKPYGDAVLSDKKGILKTDENSGENDY